MQKKYTALIKNIKEENVNAEPLKKLNKSLKRKLHKYFVLSMEDNDKTYNARKNPEYQTVKKFLSKNLNNKHYHA